ncbi:sulfate adenylyltransferase subunit 1 [Diaphorobacter sp.]|uniref:sulfate adenylyltransferase subunit 1 n=1 Tax=Diaphorobacter sp. TaxID=1934310 RepID=UPI003D11D9C2
MTTNTINSIASSAYPAMNSGKNDHYSALKFITCGSVDDGKSTLIGRLLVDSKAVLQDHLAGVQRQGETDLALLTDGLSAEREQGITIDVAYRYFATEERKFIIGDAPGHEQYTRNMVTAASQADAAVVLVDATKLDWQNPQLQLLPQTRRHSLLVHLLRVHSLVFAVNKLDAVPDPQRAFAHIAAALARFAQDAGIQVAATVPVSALKGWNVVDAQPGWCGYAGPSLLQILELLPNTPADTGLPLAFPVQWVEKFSASSDTSQGRRVFWGRVAAGSVQPGMPVQIFPSGQLAGVAQVLDHTRRPVDVDTGQSAGIVLDREVDVSRGDWIVAAPVPGAPADDDFDTPAAQPAWPGQREISATVAWMDNEPLVAGRAYWALHGHRWVKAKVRRVVHRLDINTLAEEDASQLEPNAIGHIELLLQEPLPTAPFAQARVLGSLILVDTASHATAGAVLVNTPNAPDAPVRAA